MQKQEEVTTRLKQILDIFLRDNFVMTDNVYFEKLISHLQAKENEFVLQAPFIIEWVDKCLTLITTDFNKVHPRVISFMLNLVSFMASNEWMIIRLRELDIMHRLMSFMTNEHNFSPSIKLSGIRVMKAVNNYSMGLAFQRMQRSWTLLIQYSNNEHTLYVVREARQLLYEMLYKFCDKMHDEAVTLEILAEIMKPIHENVYITDNVSTSEDQRIHVSVDDNELLHKVSSTVDLLSYILQQTLVSEERTRLVALLRDHHNIELNIWKLVEMTHNIYFTEKMLNTLCSFHFALLVHEKILNPDCAEPPEQFTEFGLSFFNLMKFCIQRCDGINLIKMAELHHILWKKLGSRAPKEIIIQDERVVFENQLICLHLAPLLFSMKFAIKMADESKSELFDSYIMKLLVMSCEQTLRLCYSLRDAFITPEGNTNMSLFTPVLTCKCVNSILSLEHILDREQAITLVQALLYALREVVALSDSSKPMDPEDCHGPSRAEPPSNSYFDIYPRGSEVIVNDPKVLHSVIVGLRALIERFKITWKESVETIGLVNCLAYVLENCNMDVTCTVQALKLVQLAVEHFLSPNMALLVDNLQGSALVCLGPIIVKRMHDTTWEVRDSALELATSIACISRIKFPAFQRFLIDVKIPPIVYEMAKHDSEPYVRASAYKCLSKMVPINALWENGLSQLDLVDHLLYVLYRENEDIVRAEAILTLCKIYDHRKIPSKYKNTLFSTLNYCIVGDHHWEVKVNALGFWKMEFQRQLKNQGMIDGIFPTVTFSKEHKKIVTLTEREIKLRVAKVLAEVQQYGYYGIILKVLKDEYAIEVLKIIVSGINTMNERLKKYDFEIILNYIETLTPAAGQSEDISTSSAISGTTGEQMSIGEDQEEGEEEPASINERKANDVIESILNVQDAQLLERTFESQMRINNEEQQQRHIDEFYYKQFAVTVREWNTEVGKFDLDKLVLQQEEWFDCKDNLICLLDDILNVIKRDADNVVSDCY